MSRVNNASDSVGALATNTTQTNDIKDLDVNDFLQLMITELTNQDPLSPMDNDKLVTQINTIREISATDKLTETLEAVLTGSNLTAASSMIGKEVSALSDELDEVQGVVQRVTIDVDEDNDNQRTYKLKVVDDTGTEHSVNLRNVREVLSN